jgi:hypothetical protein
MRNRGYQVSNVISEDEKEEDYSFASHAAVITGNSSISGLN